MRYLRFQLLAVLLCLISNGIAAANVLRVDSVKYPAGKTVSLPIHMENQSDIAGVQFDISVPFELVTDDNGDVAVTLATNRAPYHTVVSTKTGTQWRNPNSHGGVSTYHIYRIIVYSNQNQLMLDNQGTLLTLQVPLPVGLANEAQLPVYLLDKSVILSNRQKENVATGQQNGLITIEEIPRPDLMPTDITFQPSTINPGEKLTVSWTVKNEGTKPTDDGWSEQLSLVTLAGNVTKQLATVYYDQTLGAKSEVSRTAEIEMPTLLGIDGIAKVQVAVTPKENTGEHPSALDNNTAQSATNITVGKQLTLELSRLKVNESSNQRIAAKLSRSGRWDQVRTFAVTATPSDPRLERLEHVTVPVNQSGVVFYIDVKDNDVLDNDSLVTITVSGDNYVPATASLIIEDSEFPALTIKASQSVVTEGDTFQLTISTERVSPTPVTVMLTSEDTKRFKFPSQVVLPAGEQSVTVDVTAVDNDVPNLEQANIFTASAQRYTKGEATVILKDNDMPVLTLTLTPNTVSESAGVTAVSAELRRTGSTSSKITIKISDDSNGGLYYSNNSLVMDKGVERIFFNLGPVDNVEKEGDRTYTISAGVWVSSCSCAASGEAAGSVQAQLTVLDNDGAALSVSSQAGTVKEGGETTLTVSRNTTQDVSSPLTVTLSSNYDEELEYQKTATIPAGETSVDVRVVSKRNEVSGDSHTVVFTVAADGYSSGTCFLLVTDQTLPDALVESLTASVQEAMVGTPFSLTLTIKNDGAYPLPERTPVTFYKKGSSVAIATMYTQKDLPVGSTDSLTRNFTLPDKVGEHVYYAVINEQQQVGELVYTNNTSPEITIKATSPFTASVKTDKKFYRQGETVTITGQLTGEKAVNSTIDIYMINNGAREVKNVTTDADGQFTYEWQLYALQSGHFSLGACYKDDPTTEEMASFDVYGLKRTENGYITCDVTCGEAYKGQISLVNAGSLPLTGVKAEMAEGPEGCDAQFTIPANIAANEQVSLTYVLNGSVPTSGNDWATIKVRITSAEGAFLEVPVYYYARLATGNLVVEKQNLVTTINKDNGRDYSFNLSNNGKGNTGTISLSLPDWMKAITGATMPGLNKNDTTTVVLRMTPTSDMQLNVPVTGRIGINCANGNGTFINFNITPVSDKTGTLEIDVTDEYTYYTEEKPHVSGADVVIKNPVTGALIAQGKSGDDGLYRIDLPEGYYQVNVTADKHDSYKNNILVDPGTTTSKVVCLSYQAITVSWDVQETEVEDEYSITTTVTYETNVPAPVVEVIEPDALELEQMGSGESQIYHAILTNKGLITANHTNYTIPERVSGFKWEALVDSKDFSLSPQQSYTIPVKITRMGHKKDTHGVGVQDFTHSETEWNWDYEPNITEPVVEVTEPEDMDINNFGDFNIGDSRTYNVKLKNKGTVTVYDVSYSVPTLTGDYKWDMPTQFNNLTLQPDETIDIPVRVTKLSHEEAIAQGSTDDGGGNSGGVPTAGARMSRSASENKPCIVNTATDYQFECGPEGKYGWYPHTIQINKKCSEDNRSWYTIYGKGLGSPGGDDGSNNYSSSSNNGQVSVEKDCDPCTNTYVQKWGECAVAFVPKFGCMYGSAACLRDSQKPVDWRFYTSCTLTGIGCGLEFCTDAAIGATLATFGLSTALTGTIAAGCAAAGTAINVAGCLISLTEPCDENHPWWKAFTPFSWRGPAVSRRAAPAAEPSWLTSYRLAAEIPAQEQWAFNAIMIEIFGDSVWVRETSEEEIHEILSVAVSQEGTATVDQLRSVKPQGITEAQLARFVERLNNSTAFEQNGTESENRIRCEEILKYVELIELAEAASREMGYKSTDEMWLTESAKFKENVENKGNSVCATVSLQINQTMTMTRQAFRGTLTVYNGNKSQAMKDVKLKLNVTNSKTLQVATAKEFEMHTESLVGFKGDLLMDSGWYLGTDSTGTATILFIPSKYAAPDEPVDYSFGGTLSYVDPYTDLEVTRELYPVTLTVKPSPELDMTYFMQRDIMGDDALTEEVEPMEPAEFALLINNKGNGDATNVRMVTNQPEIIDNQKGLLIDFEFVASQLNGQEKTLALGQAIPTDFGTIPAHTQAYAQWWLQSTLLGHFVDYDIQATHVTSYGNENLSLLDQVTIHELIRGFTPDSQASTLDSQPSTPRAFLVNDVADGEDLPDAVYFTDATQDVVNIITNAEIKKSSATEYELVMTPSVAGWGYGSLLDPTVGRQKLIKIVRMSDGKEMPLDNIWQTNRTLKDGRNPVKENKLHFVANVPLDGETYQLTFADKPAVDLEVKEFRGVPAAGTLQKEQLREVTVEFNKAIDATTFTTDDITLACQGVQLDAKLIGIEQLGDAEFKLDLSAVSGADGYYVLTVQCATITDAEGFQGITGKQASWVQYADGKVNLVLKASPAEGGTVVPASGAFGYNQPVTLTATAAEGYDFSLWKDNDEVVSEQPSFSYTPQGSTVLTAVFTPKYYDLTIAYNAKYGVVEGGGTGRYTYGTQLTLTATPLQGYLFSGWVVEGDTVSTEATLTWTVTATAMLEAVFVEKPTVTLSGKVIDANDETPIEGAEVTLVNGDIVYTTTTDRFGEYTVEIKEKTLSFDISCQADGYMWSPTSQIWFTSGPQVQNFALLPGATVILPESGACTFSSVVNLTLDSEKVKAWYLTDFDQQSFVAEEITSGSLPAGEGVILVGIAGQRIDFAKAATAAPVSGNLLTGTAQAPYTVSADDVYVMQEDGEPSFTLSARGLVVPKAKAYCQYTMSGGQLPRVSIIWTDKTLVDAVKAAIEAGEFHYGLSGRRIYKTDKGVHLVRGKKIMKK